MDDVHPLRAFREEHVPPLSQEALADMLGKHRITVLRWEKGARLPEAEDLPVISKATGIPPEKLRPDFAKAFAEATKAIRRPARQRRSGASERAA